MTSGHYGIPVEKGVAVEGIAYLLQYYLVGGDNNVKITNMDAHSI